MFTMGDDFQYQNAVMNFKNMDKVVSTIIKSTFDGQTLLIYMQKYLEVILQTQL